jgi:beta-1,2-mannobiose phosphorylase / 1,2-beta-oligomannan phosphorylase
MKSERTQYPSCTWKEYSSTMDAIGIAVERIHQRIPIITPTTNPWEDWVTSNASSVYLGRGMKNDEIIRKLLNRTSLDDPKLADGVVVIHYRAVPKKYKVFPPSSIGLAIFTPQLELLQRYSHPVLKPGEESHDYDYHGVEDPRITKIGDIFYMLYCGYRVEPGAHGIISPCYARSTDLIYWEKMGVFDGEVVAPIKIISYSPEKSTDIISCFIDP